jgi:F0F1-type ATP synthase assembly protein I
MNDRQKRSQDYIQYSSAGIQMVLTILLFTYLGYRLDRHFESKPLWTALLSIFGVVIAMIFMVKAFTKVADKKKGPKNENPKKEDPKKP